MKKILLLFAAIFTIWSSIEVSAGTLTQEMQTSFNHCLGQKGAKLYVAWWCPYCAEQLRLLGENRANIAVIECAEGADRGKFSNPSCFKLRGVPAWEKSDGTISYGARQNSQLSELYACPIPE